MLLRISSFGSDLGCFRRFSPFGSCFSRLVESHFFFLGTIVAFWRSFGLFGTGNFISSGGCGIRKSQVSHLHDLSFVCLRKVKLSKERCGKSVSHRQGDFSSTWTLSQHPNPVQSHRVTARRPLAETQTGVATRNPISSVSF